MRVHLDPVGGLWPVTCSSLGCSTPFPTCWPACCAASAVAAGPELELRLLAADDGVLVGRRFTVALQPDRADPVDDATVTMHRRRPAGGACAACMNTCTGATCEQRLASQRSRCRRVLQHALAIFGRLADAEGRVHGVAPAEVAFHEVGAWDSIADIVGAAHLIDALGSVRWTVGPVPLGSGRVQTAPRPVAACPAPATAVLLTGLRCDRRRHRR